MLRPTARGLTALVSACFLAVVLASPAAAAEKAGDFPPGAFSDG